MTLTERLNALFTPLVSLGGNNLTSVLVLEIEKARVVINDLTEQGFSDEGVSGADLYIETVKSYLAGEISYDDCADSKDLFRDTIIGRKATYTEGTRAYGNYTLACLDLPIDDMDWIEAHMTVGGLIDFYLLWTPNCSRIKARNRVLKSLRDEVKHRMPLTRLAIESRTRNSLLAS